MRMVPTRFWTGEKKSQIEKMIQKKKLKLLKKETRMQKSQKLLQSLMKMQKMLEILHSQRYKRGEIEEHHCGCEITKVERGSQMKKKLWH